MNPFESTSIEPRPLFDQSNPDERFYDFTKMREAVLDNPLASPEYKEQQRLEKLNREIAKIQEYKAQSSNIFHKSLQEIFTEMADAFLGIIEDLFYPPVEIQDTPELNIADHLYITFTRKNRLIYIGLVVLFVTLLSYTLRSLRASPAS